MDYFPLLWLVLVHIPIRVHVHAIAREDFEMATAAYYTSTEHVHAIAREDFEMLATAAHTP
jgi:hypothetical protein